MQVFTGAFIGYAAFYLVRKNFSMAIPFLDKFGIDKGELGTVLAMNAIAYALSKFLMGSVSDRSNARKFLPLGLILSALAMAFMVWPIQAFDLVTHPENKIWALMLLGFLNFLVGWFNGMGWPPCGRIMTHWFSLHERGTWMSVWNCAHNVGGALVGPMAVYGAAWFGSWFYGQNSDLYFLAGTFLFPAAVGLLIAIVAYCLLRDTPQSVGLPSIEKWRNDYPKNYSAKSEEVLTTKEIFFKYVFNNKFLWFIACANAFIYMVRYGALDWAPPLLTNAGFDIKQAGWAYFAFEIAAIPGTLFCGWLSDKVFNGRRAVPTIIFMALIIVFLVLYWIPHLRTGDADRCPGPRPRAKERIGYRSRSHRILRILLRNSPARQHAHRLGGRQLGVGIHLRMPDRRLSALHHIRGPHLQRGTVSSREQSQAGRKGNHRRGRGLTA